ATDSSTGDFADEPVAPFFSADESNRGLNSFPPPFFVKDLLFVWLDRVSGSSSVHIQATPTTIVGVDFSIDTVSARFFDDFGTWVDALQLLIKASSHDRVSPNFSSL
ncbi:hypothetical protein H0E87_029737, partial [Populus deltoides]